MYSDNNKLIMIKNSQVILKELLKKYDINSSIVTNILKNLINLICQIYIKCDVLLQKK